MAPRGIKTAAFALITALIMGLMCACSADAPAWDAATPDGTPMESAAPIGGERTYERLELMRHEELVDDRSVMLCPAVADSEYGYISTLIAIRVRSKIRSYDFAVSTSFRIKCNANGVLSMMISFYDMDNGELIDNMPLTYDIALGREIQIQDCFEEGDGSWRSGLSALVQSAAEERNMTLLSDILPIEDGRMFYLTGASIAVMYRPYEITTISEPWPEFMIPLTGVRRWIKPNGALERQIRAIDAQAGITGAEYGGGAVPETAQENAVAEG